MAGLTKCSWGLSVNTLWPAGETGRPTRVWHRPRHLQAGRQVPCARQWGWWWGTCVLSPRENAPMASLSLGSGFIFIHPIISVG